MAPLPGLERDALSVKKDSTGLTQKTYLMLHQDILLLQMCANSARHSLVLAIQWRVLFHVAPDRQSNLIFSTTFNTPYMCPKIRCDRYYMTNFKN